MVFSVHAFRQTMFKGSRGPNITRQLSKTINKLTTPNTETLQTPIPISEIVGPLGMGSGHRGVWKLGAGSSPAGSSGLEASAGPKLIIGFYV